MYLNLNIKTKIWYPESLTIIVFCIYIPKKNTNRYDMNNYIKYSVTIDFSLLKLKT